MTSHFMMPPKMLTRMALTRSSAVMILKAAVICSVLAEPPTCARWAQGRPVVEGEKKGLLCV
jgi:hypothetical protein